MVVVGGCGAAGPDVVANRGGSPMTSCPSPRRLVLQARRYANLDADEADYQKWTPWRVQLELTDELRGTLVMTGDRLDWKLQVAGRLDPVHCELTLAADSHEPVNLRIHLGPPVTGDIRSIDDVWLLGPPFPARR
jgi:hypothetical protein